MALSSEWRNSAGAFDSWSSAPPAGADDADRLPPGDRAVGHVLVQPGERFPAAPGLGAAADLEVGPRADGQPDVHAAAGEHGVLLQGLLEDLALPAADLQDRRGDPLQRGAGATGLPPRIGGLGAGGPLPVPG